MDGFILGIMLVILAGVLEGLFSQGVTRTPQLEMGKHLGAGIARVAGAGSLAGGLFYHP